jgi:hypothetical protein
MTGHDNGLITIALAESDDVERERRRKGMGEPYRTLLGHFRHEIGHHYWDLLVRDEGRLEACRAVFGDDEQDYGAALQRHYAEGPPADWQEEVRFSLRDDPPLGGLRRNLGALPPHRRYDGDGGCFRRAVGPNSTIPGLLKANLEDTETGRATSTTSSVSGWRSPLP